MASIAIVGAGPAGSAAAFHLATRGHAVTLVDRADFPRDKTCGDWLTPAALSELATLGLDADALDREAPGHATISRTMLVAPDGRFSVHRSAVPGRCIPRRSLDAMLVAQATRAGAMFVRRAMRDLRRDDPVFASHDHVIDARGAAVGHPNAIGLRGYWTLRRDAPAADRAAQISLHTDARFRRGYGWIFPVHVDPATVRYNIGVGLFKEDSRRGRTVADFLAHFLARDPAAREICAAASETTRPVGYPVALGGWRNRVAADGVLRIGDAAALADPLTGDGIGNALASGRLVAEAIDAARAGDAAAEWQRSCDAMLVPELRRALVLRQLLIATPMKNLAAFASARGPVRFRDRLHGAVFGATGYRELI
jgi:menaquinone-9 beta-reductase